MDRTWHSRWGAVITLAVLACVGVGALAACGGPSTSAASSASAAAASPSPSWSPTMSPAAIPVVEPGDKLPPFPEIKALYEYDRSEPLNTSMGISYPSEYGAVVQAIAFNVGGESYGSLLTTPEGEGPFPVVLFAVGSGGDPTQWLPDSGVLAKKGYATLLLDPTYVQTTGKPEADGRGFVDYVVHIRRALDALETLPQIDASRIGFVGWSFGANVGALFSGVDDRVKAFALNGEFTMDESNWLPSDPMGPGMTPKRYGARMSPFEPDLYFSHNRDARFLLLWGTKEGRQAMIKQWRHDAAPTHAEWYLFNGGHAFDTPRAYVDAWIAKNL
jgi:dienelactone hydrolase